MCKFLASVKLFLEGWTIFDSFDPHTPKVRQNGSKNVVS